MGKICKCCRVGGKVKLKKVWFLFKFKMVFRVVFFCFGVGGRGLKNVIGGVVYCLFLFL